MYNQIRIKTTTSIVIKVELSFKSSVRTFEKEYLELYKKRITHEFIRNELGLSEEVKIKLNGTFTRKLYILDENNNICRVSYKMQTAIWTEPLTNRSIYVSIFPCFIKKYCPLSLHLLENISCNTRKGENVFKHIDDPKCYFDCEDSIMKVLRKFEKEFKIANPSALLNSKYVEVYNRSIRLDSHLTSAMRFQRVFELILVARFFFGIEYGLLSLTNTILRL
jgi:hypothetical protein